MIYVVDSHALVWHLQGGHRLSPASREVLDDPNARLVIPVIALVELKYLSSRGRIGLTYEEIIDRVSNDPRTIIAPLTIENVELMPLSLDIHDAAICATTLLYQEVAGQETVLITADREIRESGIVKTLW